LAIINNGDPGGTHDVIVYYVDNPDKSYTGMSPVPGTYCFVYDTSQDERITTAHKLGHARFELYDIDNNGPGELAGDSDNIMWHQFCPNKWRLRKGQWSDIQAKQ